MEKIDFDEKPIVIFKDTRKIKRTFFFLKCIPNESRNQFEWFFFFVTLIIKIKIDKNIWLGSHMWPLISIKKVSGKDKV